jgi:hypothetical protein
MIVRQEQIIADIVAFGRDPHDATKLLERMEDLVRTIHQSIDLSQPQRH